MNSIALSFYTIYTLASSPKLGKEVFLMFKEKEILQMLEKIDDSLNAILYLIKKREVK